jgi:hypothetical protein
MGMVDFTGCSVACPLATTQMTGPTWSPSLNSNTTTTSIPPHSTSHFFWRWGTSLQPPSRLESVNEFTEQMKTTLEEAKAALAKSKDDMAWYSNPPANDTPKM